MLLGGCGGSASTGVAHLSTQQSAATTSAPTGESAPEATSVAQKMVNYSRCMRTHGVENFPEAQEGEIRVRPESGIDPGSAVFQSAEKACHELLPSGVSKGAGARAGAPRLVPGLLSFAACMRAHGISDFPDPKSDGELSVEMVKGAGVDVHAPPVQSAARTCLPASHGALTAQEIKRAESGGS